MKKEMKKKDPTYHVLVTFLDIKGEKPTIELFQLNLRAESTDEADKVVIKQASAIWPSFKWVTEEVL